MLPDSPAGLILIFLAGFGAAAVNAVAGGGSLISFPTLVAMGVPDIRAAATNTAGLWAGSLSSAVGFLPALRDAGRVLILLVPLALAGSAFGAWLLSVTDQDLFQLIVPVLVLTATLILAFDSQVRKLSRRLGVRWMVAPLVLLIGIYGGYAGAGIGVMILATLALQLSQNLHALNALKNWLALSINIIGTIVLAFAHLVNWAQAGSLALGALIGGYVSAHYAQKIEGDRLKPYIVVYGLIMTGWFMFRAWL